MESRTAIHEQFVAKFHFGNRPTPATAQQLDEIETELQAKLPASYRQFMTRFGSVYTPSILDEIVEGSVDHPDVQNLLDPREVIDGTRGYWSAGMPNDLIGIASDCMGNMIGFRRLIEPSDDAPVVFFDHDSVDTYQLAGSFDEFLGWYVRHLKGQLAVG